MQRTFRVLIGLAFRCGMTSGAGAQGQKDWHLFKDFTVIKVMLTAIVVGGIGVFLLVQMGYTMFHIKQSDLLALSLGAELFGIGMVLYGYCSGTAVAAIGAGTLSFDRRTGNQDGDVRRVHLADRKTWRP